MRSQWLKKSQSRRRKPEPSWIRHWRTLRTGTSPGNCKNFNFNFIFIDSPEEEEASSSEEEKPVPAKVPKKEKEDKVAKSVKPASQQASYIMKLFDRSVNLAKFTEETALFPLCRELRLNACRELPLQIFPCFRCLDEQQPASTTA